MKGEDYRRILDFFFSGVEVSEELKQRYLGWLAAYGDEPEVKALLEEYWDSVSSDSPDFDLTAGLERLMASLGEDGASTSSASIEGTAPTAQRLGWLSNLLHSKPLRYCVTAAAAVAIFIGGATVARMNMAPERETVLIASSDNVGSYTLPDDTRVWLNRDSRLSYNQDFGKSARNVSIDGEGYLRSPETRPARSS